MPSILRNILLRLRLIREQRRYRGLARGAVFDLIYERHAWGGRDNGKPYSGSGSHYEELTAPYVKRVNAFLASLDDPSVVDLGCGDYAVGSRLQCASYIGCDISEVVLTSNRTRFPDVEFRQLDFIEDPLPHGDIGIVRQVLQHLDNASIARFVAKPLPYKYLIVTEGLPTGPFKPNLDKPVGPAIRLPLNSGVDLNAPPFNAGLETHSSFEVKGVVGNIPNVLRTTIYRL